MFPFLILSCALKFIYWDYKKFTHIYFITNQTWNFIKLCFGFDVGIVISIINKIPSSR